jgi:hypothetical protein
VILVGAGGRHPLPAVVAPGTYAVEAAFGSDAPVPAGNAKISEAGGEVVACNANMGICRAR